MSEVDPRKRTVRITTYRDEAGNKIGELHEKADGSTEVVGCTDPQARRRILLGSALVGRLVEDERE